MLSDILQIYFLVRNIDRWTVGKFRELVVHGIRNLVEAIVHKKQKYKPWKRVGELSPVVSARKENVNTSATVTSSSSMPSPPQTKNKRRRAR
jgi:solute carrier family 25 (mitochondrial carnitine/acylcarnitine transporter), member 20/29